MNAVRPTPPERPEPPNSCLAGRLVKWRACGGGTLMQTPDVVVLVPGFLGFARLGGFYYFAVRLIAVLMGLLEEPLGSPVPAVPRTSLSTTSIAKRQRRTAKSYGDSSPPCPS